MTTGVPEHWTKAPTGEQVAYARERALEALDDGVDFPASERLSRYYDRDGNYAGVSFVEMQPSTPDVISAAALHAVSLLGGTDMLDWSQDNEALKAKLPARAPRGGPAVLKLQLSPAH